jgi:dTDP-4-dehydrorhamnose 3,5-epimerase-like enzyme
MDDVKVLNGGIAVDDRGSVSFVNDFDFNDVKRFYQVSNHDKNFVRAWHGHEKEGKYVYVVKGTALVGAVPFSEEALWKEKMTKVVLSDKKPQILWIPHGYANGFMNLEEDTIIQFFSTSTLEESKGDDIRFPFDKWNIWEKDYR